MIQTIFQIYRDDCEFIKEIHHRHLDYESLDEYQRKVIETKVKVQKKRLCEWKRSASWGPHVRKIPDVLVLDLTGLFVQVCGVSPAPNDVPRSSNSHHTKSLWQPFH